jgi:non-specific serine/threonine protein kinase/serine/threonine-protein kinase
LKDENDIPTEIDSDPGEAPTIAEPIAETIAEPIGPAFGGDDDLVEGVSRVIGNYRLLRPIGEGGMGEVFEAEQLEPVQRRVAFKVIKPGMDSRQIVARFEIERQALALMDHSAIAKVFDAGTTPRGRPFFVMEYVAGPPITDYCDRNGFGLRERLELFIQVCEGVQHAHQKAIIHRDLKPSNVLVAEQDERAVPKIIDFGIAKATSDDPESEEMFTQIGQLLGTPEYMSPEQAEGLDVDTRTDVYALGVLLYELLVGALPFDSEELRKGGFEGIRKCIREVEPKRPSTRVTTGPAGAAVADRTLNSTNLTRELKGDLDWIILKSIEKDRDRRYGSPAEFVADIRRYLANEPVLASSPTTAYRVQKFIKRHTFGVGIAALTVMVIISFAIVMTVQAGRIARERDRANEESETAKQVSDFLFGLFEISDPRESMGNTITAREILDEGAAKVRQDLKSQPRVQARMMDTMGRVYRSLGLYSEARPLVQEALEILRTDAGDDNLEFAETANNLGTLLLRTGEYDSARALFARALEIRERELDPLDRDLASVLNNMGSLSLRTGEFDRAQEYYDRALLIYESDDAGEGPLDTARTLNNLALVARRRADPEEARRLYEASLRIIEAVRGPQHPDTAQALTNLATLLKGLGESDAAKRLFERSLSIREKTLGGDHPAVADTLNNLGNLLDSMGDRREARRSHERALAIRERTLAADHPDVAMSLGNIENLSKSEGRLDEAREYSKRSLSILETALGPQHRRVANNYYNLAGLEALRGERDESLRLLTEAIDRGFRMEIAFDDPDFSSLHGDPAFEVQLERIRTLRRET